MPIYEYQCQACGHILDALQKLNDSPLKKCPDCGKPKLKRLLSAPMFLLKGTGWYETDFKSDKEARRNLHAPDKDETAVESKPDTKPEATLESKPKPEAKPEAGPQGGAAEPAARSKTKAKAASRPRQRGKTRSKRR